METCNFQIYRLFSTLFCLPVLEEVHHPALDLLAEAHELGGEAPLVLRLEELLHGGEGGDLWGGEKKQISGSPISNFC